MNALDYWKECISIAAEECDATLTAEQLEHMAGSVKSGHETYDMAFYSPPSSDRFSSIEREWRQKCERLEKDFEAYRIDAETAVKKALRQYDDAHISIHEGGEVLRHGGRTERIQ